MSRACSERTPRLDIRRARGGTRVGGRSPSLANERGVCGGGGHFTELQGHRQDQAVVDPWSC